MVQEVQTWVGIYNETTLETIEAIGTSSFKIKEWRQTTPRYLWEVTGSGTVNRHYVSPNVDSGMIMGTMTISDMVGKAEYSISNGWIRVPFAGTYRITYRGTVGSAVADTTLYLKAGTESNSPTLWTKTYNTWGVNESGSVIVDLGKFDIVTLRVHWYYTSTYASGDLSNTLNVTIQQL